jgi:ketosteroid isomerase-like protein
MTDRVAGSMADTCVRLFGRGEAFDSEGFIGFFTDNPMYQFGNGEPCLTKAAIKASVDAFFGGVEALYHDLRNVWEVGNCVFVEMDVIYWRKDGTNIKLPCADIFRFEGDKILELRIFMDANPVFVPTMAVGEKASVMTLSEGKQVTGGGALRKYFAQHKEGVARVAAGFIPKWHIAGPKWPIRPMGDILKDFQGAIASGNSEAAKSHLTENAMMRVGNRSEVTGAQAVMDTLRNLFTKELRPAGATFIEVWETDPKTLVVEMTVKATRPSDGSSVEYPCVETYRFEGDKIREWRIYPLVGTLLAPESFAVRA